MGKTYWIIFFLLCQVLSAQDIEQNSEFFKLKTKFLGEQTKVNHVYDALNLSKMIVSGEKNKVKYLTTDEALLYELKVYKGRVYVNDKLYSTNLNRSRPHSIFTVSLDGRIFICDCDDLNVFHHSSFVSGEPVRTAGELFVIDGRIIAVNNKSGHYKPTYRSLDILKLSLQNMGLENTNKIYFFSEQEYEIGKKNSRLPICNRFLIKNT